jgi:hypothetical protein
VSSGVKHFEVLAGSVRMNPGVLFSLISSPFYCIAFRACNGKLFPPVSCTLQRVAFA